MRKKCVKMSENANKMRDRLIELQCLAYDTYEGGKTSFEHTADVLLANGVVALPCKVGDIIWVKDYERNCEIQKAEIIAILKNRYGMYIRYEYPAFRGRVYERNVEYIGKDVFLTEEEVERALKNG